MREVLWLAMGGTLQAQGHDPADRDAYWRTGRSVPAQDLLRAWPAGAAQVRVEQVASGASHDLGAGELLDLVRRLRRLDPETTSGAVVSLGSNALEEVAFLLWLLGPGTVPVVLTAAMRPPTALGSDAEANLIAALTLAAHPEGLTAGAAVVSDGAVLHPVGLTKTHTAAVDSFRAGGRVLGAVEPGRAPRFDLAGTASPLAGSPVPRSLAPVLLVASHLGGDATLVRAAVASGASGLVSTGLGAGFPPRPERAALIAAQEAGVVVCLARRTAYGRTVGSQDTAPLLSAGGLSPLQARLLLAVVLADGTVPDVQALVDACG